MMQNTNPAENYSNNDDSEMDLPPTLEETKDYFQKFISKLIKTAQNYDPKPHEPTPEGTSESVLEVKPISEETSEKGLEEELVSDIIYNKRNSYLHEKLQQKLEKIKEKYKFTVLEEFFYIFIDEWIQKNREKKINLSSLKEIFNSFAKFEMKKIPKKALEKLIAALQWEFLPAKWLNSENFLSDYFDNLLPSDTSDELRNQTWVLLELTRIKLEEEQRKREIIKETN